MTDATGNAPPPGAADMTRRGVLAGVIAGIPATAAAGCADTAAPAADVGAGGPIVPVSAFGVRPDRDGDANTVALNDAIRAVAMQGGGTLMFDRAERGYTVIGPVILPSNITIDLNGQVLRGRRKPSDVMFVTGTVVAGRLSSNLGSSPETALVSGAAIRGGRIEDCNRVFHFRNFGQGCYLRDIVTQRCTQVGRFERCFFSILENISAAGFSEPNTPTFHFIDQTNAVVLRRLSAVSTYGFCLEAGAAAVTFDGCTFEGGTTGVRLIGDCLGVQFRGCYFEAVDGRAFDLRRAGACTIDWDANYFNHVDIVLDDGGDEATATLFGSWRPSNYIVMATTPAFARLKPARRMMLVNGPRNFVSFDLPYSNDVAAVIPGNWKTSKNSRIASEIGFTGNTLTDVRARTHLRSGIIPTTRSGDTGSPFPGTVPFTTMRATQGGSAIQIVDTAIAWQPDSLFAKFIFRIQDDEGFHRLFGDIYGDAIVRGDRTQKRIEIANRGGFVSISIGSFKSTIRKLVCTGTVQIVT